MKNLLKNFSIVVLALFVIAGVLSFTSAATEKPEVVGVPVKVNVLFPVPPDAVNVSKATIPDVVVILPTVKVSWTGGLMVIAYTFDVVASAESVAVTVS